MNRYKGVDFEIHSRDGQRFSYTLHDGVDVFHSTDYFVSRQEACFAAIGHIELLHEGCDD